MNSIRNRKTRLFLSSAVIGMALASSNAHAMNRKSIILHAAGSGALIGTAAGVVSYPFAKSFGTIIAGAAVGAILGTVYGIHLADVREEQFAQTPLSDLDEMNSERDARLRRGAPVGSVVVLQLPGLRF